ncbi:MAG: hypothetical protein HOV80_35825 [Polyangiaceae bacterium]|nr:hypothetical protein [Polyangiaceae bacterium]
MGEALEVVDPGDGPLEGLVSVPWAGGDPPLSARSPTVAWIPNSYSDGGVLVGYTVDDGTGQPLSAWSFKPTWQSSAAWAGSDGEHLASNDALLPWPSPVDARNNHPELPQADWDYSGVAEVASGAMPGVGVLANYAWVPDSQEPPYNRFQEVVIVTGLQAAIHGPHFLPVQAHALTWPLTEETETGPVTYASGGGVTPGSVDIALAVNKHQFEKEPYVVGRTFYVVWENRKELDEKSAEYFGWWLVWVGVGPDGTSTIGEPQRLDFIPYGSYVSVGSRLGAMGERVVELAWATVDGVPPTCPSTETVEVSWYHAVSTNEGELTCVNEPCSGTALGVGETLVDTDPHYRFCVGQSDEATGEITSPRPELAFDDLGEMEHGRQRRFLAYPRSDASGARMMIRVRRDNFAFGDPAGAQPLPTFAWQKVFDTTGEGDAFAPVLHVSPGRMFSEALFPLHELDEHAAVGLLYRQIDDVGMVRVNTAHSNESGDPSTWRIDPGSTISRSAATETFAQRQGLTAMPRCMEVEACPEPAIDTLWYGVWTDERDGSSAQIYGATFANGGD